MMGTTYNTETRRPGTNVRVETGDGRSLTWLFEQTAVRHGFKTAVVCGSHRMTYADLNRAANRMADRLTRMSLGHGHLAAIYLDRSVEMVVSLLAVLKCGAGYLPIDPGYPRARVLQTLADARPTILITTKTLAAKLPKDLAKTLEMVILDGGSGLGATEVDGSVNPPLKTKADDVAYVIYTSGSTGKPKGVQVTHRNVARLMEQTQPWFHFDEKDVWTMFHSLAFDFSVWEIWGCLLTGGRLVIVPFDVSRSPEEFYMLLAEQRVTVLNQTPSAFSLLMHVEEGRMKMPLALRLIVFGGEALYPKRLQAWFERHGETMPKLVNMYGITETTVHVSYRAMTMHDAESELESLIGVPIPDLTIHILDSDGKPVADGKTGEMYVGGGGVAKGYLNRPTLNKTRFVANPFESGTKLYRTGDLARRREDGELVYLGRIDGQVKINGFRIELGEVESALASYPEVLQSCVVTRMDATESQRLAAYYVTRNGVPVQAAELRAFLAKTLPTHMLPSFYTQLETLPLTGNGKLDRDALPAPADAPAVQQQQMADEEFDASEMEERIAGAWREALGREYVGLDDNFFDIGGTSLLLIHVRSRLQRELDRAIPVTWMFELTTVRKLAKRLDEAEEPALVEEPEMTAAQEQARKQREAFARMRGNKGGPR